MLTPETVIEIKRRLDAVGLRQAISWDGFGNPAPRRAEVEQADYDAALVILSEVASGPPWRMKFAGELWGEFAALPASAAAALVQYFAVRGFRELAKYDPNEAREVVADASWHVKTFDDATWQQLVAAGKVEGDVFKFSAFTNIPPVEGVEYGRPFDRRR